MCTYSAYYRTTDGRLCSTTFDADARRGSRANGEAAAASIPAGCMLVNVVTGRRFAFAAPGAYYPRHYREMSTNEGETIKPRVSTYGYQTSDRRKPHDLYIGEDGRAWIVTKWPNEDGTWGHGYAPAPDGSYASRYDVTAPACVVANGRVTDPACIPATRKGSRKRYEAVSA